MGEVEDVEVFVDIVFLGILQHGVAPKEISLQAVLIVVLHSVECNAILFQLVLKLCDRFFPALACDACQKQESDGYDVTK